MLTMEQIENLKLGLTIDAQTEIMLKAGVEWIENNTIIDTADIENFPNCAKLFLIKFTEIQNMPTGVSSESIQGLSQSFNTDSKADMIWDIAYSLLGDYIKDGTVRFVCASPKWR